MRRRCHGRQAPVEGHRPAVAVLDRRGDDRMTDAAPVSPGLPPLRVASVPFGGAYLDAVLPEGTVRVGPATSPSPWLDADHLAASAADVDVLHVHSGHLALDQAELETWTAAVRRTGVPLVVTVHQLRPAEGRSPARHR